MIKSIFSIFDEKSKLFLPPMFYVNNGEAIRAFTDLVNNKQTFLHTHPEDYKLYYVGTFNDLTCKFQSTDQPDFLIHASDVLVNTDIPSQPVQPAQNVTETQQS